MTLSIPHSWLAFLNGPDISPVLARTDAALKGSMELIVACHRGTAALIENHGRDRRVIEQSRAAIDRTRALP